MSLSSALSTKHMAHECAVCRGCAHSMPIRQTPQTAASESCVLGTEVVSRWLLHRPISSPMVNLAE